MLTDELLISFLDKTIWIVDECQEKLRHQLKKGTTKEAENRNEYICRLRHLRYLLITLNTVISDIFINEEEKNG